MKPCKDGNDSSVLFSANEALCRRIVFYAWSVWIFGSDVEIIGGL